VRVKQLPIVESLAALWWALSLISLWVLLAAVAFASQVTRYHRSILLKLRRPTEFATTLADTPLPTTPLLSSSLRGDTRKVRRLDLFWSSITTKLTVVLIFTSAATGVLTLVLPRPAWVPLMIVVMPFLGAWFANRAWQGEED
jgi:hypothetical protein